MGLALIQFKTNRNIDPLFNRFTVLSGRFKSPLFYRRYSRIIERLEAATPMEYNLAALAVGQDLRSHNDRTLRPLPESTDRVTRRRIIQVRRIKTSSG